MYIYGTHTHSRERENNNNNIPSGYRLLLVVSLDSIPSFSFSSPKLRKKNHRVVMHEEMEKKKQGPVVGFMTKPNRKKEEKKTTRIAPLRSPPLSFIPNATPTRN
jgi:predicted ester cyclase